MYNKNHKDAYRINNNTMLLNGISVATANLIVRDSHKIAFAS